MKKIVALILALVMVMGLATVASAATFDEDATYYLYNDVQDEFYEMEYVPAEDNGDGTGNIEYFLYDSTDVFVLCDKTDDGAWALYDGDKAGDKKIGYVCAGVADYEMVMTKVAASAKFTCTTDKNAKGYKHVSPIGVVTYYKDVTAATAGTGTFVLVGDEVVEVLPQVTYATSTAANNADVEAVIGGHVFVQNKAAAKDEAKTVYEYKCVVCGMIVDGTTTKTAGVEYIPYFADASTIDAVEAAGYEVEDPAMMLYLLGGASAPAVDTEKVESAETFDAGIAMYVGMSVMAAAGSAVVLKKKD